MKKRIMLVVIRVLIVSSLFALSASASSYWYSIDVANGAGPTVSLTSSKKEYTQVTVNTENELNVIVSLYSPKFFEDKWYGDDQILDYGTNRRAWWYGDTDETQSYYIKTATLSEVMTLSGYFQNM